MKINIGMLIWKEVKAKGWSQAEFKKLLDEKNIQIRHLFKCDAIDAYALLHISQILGKNFFQDYQPEELMIFLKSENQEELRSKVYGLRAVNKEKTKLLQLQQEMINQQARLINEMEKRWPKE